MNIHYDGKVTNTYNIAAAANTPSCNIYEMSEENEFFCVLNISAIYIIYKRNSILYSAARQQTKLLYKRTYVRLVAVVGLLL